MSHEHRVTLDRDWDLWRQVWLRGTGFSADLLDGLFDPALVSTASAWVRARSRERELHQRLVESVKRSSHQAGRERFRTLQKALRRVRRGDPAPVLDKDPEVGPPYRDWSDAQSRLHEADGPLQTAYAVAERRSAEAVRAVLRNERFREALTWQNPDLLPTLRLDRRPAGSTDSKTRQQEMLVAKYVQRYALKNDTIGFFGPVGWGRWAPEAETERWVVGDPGPVVARRAVFFEHWAMDLLARRFAEDRRLRHHLPPRRRASLRLEGDVLVHSGMQKTELPPEFAHALRRSDGRTSAEQLAREMVASPELDVDEEEEAFDLLEDLVGQGLITWTLELPIWNFHPDQVLDEHLKRIPEHRGDRARAALRELQQAKKALERTAGDPKGLEAGIRELEGRFERMVPGAAKRGAGKTYGARRIFYEDCMRGGHLRLGAPLLDGLREPLGMLLDSARWFTGRIAKGFESVFDRTHREFGSDSVPLPAFLNAVEPHFAGEGEISPVTAEAKAELTRRWSELLRPEPGSRRIVRKSSPLAEAARRMFAAEQPGWTMARYHAPDLMVAAEGPEAAARGEVWVVLGELHVAINTQFAQLALANHPSFSDMQGWARHDLPDGGLCRVESRTEINRASSWPPRLDGWHLEGETRTFAERDRVLHSGELDVVRRGEGLRVRSLDGRYDAPIREALDWYLTSQAVAHFAVLPPALHRPRVTVGRLILQRESWTLEGEDLAFAHAGSALERFRGLWELRHTLGLPEQLFAKADGEPKPFYCHLGSPLWVDNLCKVSRSSTRLVLSEALPGPHQLWLTDPDGRRYASELRVVAVDKRA